MDDWHAIERFDPTWHYNFAWGHNADNDEVHVWRVQHDTDGRREHRDQLAALFGRPPHVGRGDRLGLATYIPETRKFDGTLVAPPEVQVESYYGKPIPPGVFDWFEQQFPGVVARQARLARKTANDWANPPAHDEQIRWIWNQKDGTLVWVSDRNGQPTHDEKAEAEWGRAPEPTDYLGFADVEPDKVEIDATKWGTPPVAIAMVKSELAKMFPDKQIVTPDDQAAEYGVEFSTNPSQLVRREATIRWAQDNLIGPSEDPLEGRVSHANGTHVTTKTPGSFLSGLKGLFSTKTAAEGADMEGAMVALFIPDETGKKLKIRGGEPLEQMHITLCYFVDKAADRDDWDELERIVEQVANQTPKLSGKIGGFGLFTNEADVLWASPSIKGLAELRHKIYEAANDAGFTVSDDYDWIPHITLKYDHKGKLPKLDEKVEFELAELSFAKGSDKKHFKFEGNFEKKASDDWLDWGRWGGAHRFVTDGKEILTDPARELYTANGWPGSTHEDLRTKFKSFYPDSKEMVEGWVVPTADDMGYGIYAPTAGLGGKDEPGLHEVMNVIDKEFGKPSHYVNDAERLIDPDHYTAYPEVAELGLSS